jgi:hypothetical protein
LISGIVHVALMISDIRAMATFSRDVCRLIVRRGRERRNAFA